MATQNVYDKKAKAFQNVSAFILVKNGENVGKVAFKYGAAVRCFLHIAGARMSIGVARGGGYDRASAAFQYAAECHSIDAWPSHIELIQAVKAAALKADSLSWDRALRDAGFDVWQAV